jgi:hypothetical protein
MGKRIFSYWGNILHRAWKAAETGIGVKGLIIDLLIAVIAFVIYWIVKGFPPFLQLGEGAMIAIYVYVGVIVLALFCYLFREPEVLDKEKTDRLTLKEYDDISINLFKSAETDQEKRARMGLIRTPATKKLELSIKNGGNTSILGASVLMENLKWFNPKYNNTPDGIEIKALAWEDINSNEGKRDISPGASGYLKIATCKRNTEPSFWFELYDGTSDVRRWLPGKYKIDFRLDGKAKKENTIEDLLPVHFRLSFDFESGGFENIAVTKLPREQKNEINTKRENEIKKKKKKSSLKRTF